MKIDFLDRFVITRSVKYVFYTHKSYSLMTLKSKAPISLLRIYAQGIYTCRLLIFVMLDMNISE